MNALRQYIRTLLIEGKVDDIKRRYPEASEAIDALAYADPSGSQKYLPWAVKMMTDFRQSEVGVDALIAGIKRFHEVSSRMEKKDINAYRTFKELTDALRRVKKSATSSKRETKTLGADKLHDDRNHVLLYIRNKAAAVDYGKGTKWCVSMKDVPHFETYHNRNVKMYFLFQKKLSSDDPMHKIAFAFSPSNLEIFDATDEHIDTPPELAHFEELARKHAEGLPPNETLPVAPPDGGE